MNSVRRGKILALKGAGKGVCPAAEKRQEKREGGNVPKRPRKGPSNMIGYLFLTFLTQAPAAGIRGRTRKCHPRIYSGTAPADTFSFPIFRWVLIPWTLPKIWIQLKLCVLSLRIMKMRKPEFPQKLILRLWQTPQIPISQTVQRAASG